MFHPQCNGATERQNRNIIALIRRYINEKHDDWEDLLEPLRFAYCNSANSSTHETPYFLVHGRDPVLLIDRIFYEFNKKLLTPMDYKSQLIKKLNKACAMVKAYTTLAREQFKKQYDKRAKNMQYEIGDKVLLDIRKINKNQSKKIRSQIRRSISYPKSIRQWNCNYNWRWN